MSAYEQFKLQLRTQLRRMPSDRVGVSKAYLAGGVSGLNDFVVSLCYSFLQATRDGREEICRMIADDEELWFVQQFIDCQVGQIQRTSDVEALLLGLSAVAIIGPHSDPRDISLWTFELYRAARRACIKDIQSYFLKIGDLASTEVRGSSFGASTVAEQIRTCPEREKNSVSVNSDVIDSGFDKEPNAGDCTGWTPLMNAALKRDLTRVFDLIHQGVDVNTVVNGASALALAAFAGGEDVVEMLLDCGAQVDIRPHNMSLLEFARMGNSTAVPRV